MKREIPYLFNSVIISSPLQQIDVSDSNTGRLKVGVFTKFGNRNGSYITEDFANHLINSAVSQHIPVVGFFDPQSQSWASHTGPTLAHGYGYVEDFIGWEPFEDSDGIIREYAVFSVVLHTQYFEEAKQIKGQNQSMELNPDTLEGDWATFDDQEYFVYTKGEMLGLCVIGSHEPCFSASAFFNKNEKHKTQFEQFSTLLMELRSQVEEITKKEKGGEQPMEENKILETPAEETPVVEEAVFEEKTVSEETVEEIQAPETTFEETEEENISTEENTTVETNFESEVEQEVASEEVEIETETSLKKDFEALQISYEQLQQDYNELQNSLNETNSQFEQVRINQESQINSLTEELNAAKQTIAAYEAKAAEEEELKKNDLVKSYEKIISEEEIAPIKASVADFSYDELESKLAVTFSRQHLKAATEKKVPLTETEESPFAALMKKYKR